MTDNTNVDNQNSAGAGGTTNPPASPAQGASVAVTPEALSKLVKDAIADELKPIKGEIGGLYSRQDKDRNAFREFMDEVKKQQANGLNENDAIDAAQSTLNARAESVQEKKMLKEIHEKLFGASSQTSAGNGSDGASEAGKVISEIGLSDQDANVAAFLQELRTKNLSADAQRAEVYKFAYNQKNKPSPTDAQKTANNSGAPIQKLSPEEEYAMLEKYERLSKNFHQNKDEVIVLEGNLRRAGLIK